MSKYIFILSLFILSPIITSAQIGVQVTGSWSPNVSVSDVTDAGRRPPARIFSNTSQFFLSVFHNNKNNFNWRVDFKRQDIDWHPGIILSLKRTGNGTASSSGTISNNTLELKRVETYDRIFVSGSKARNNIPIQFRIRASHLQIPAKTYTTTVIYTITEL